MTIRKLRAIKKFVSFSLGEGRRRAGEEEKGKERRRRGEITELEKLKAAAVTSEIVVRHEEGAKKEVPVTNSSYCVVCTIKVWFQIQNMN